MRIIVDRDICQAIGVCESIAPEVFEVDADGLLEIKREEVSPERLEDMQEAVERCPTGALRLES